MKQPSIALASILMLTLALAGSASAQETASRFLPDRVYTVTIKKTLSGNDGFQDLPPTTSTQRMRIETGTAQGNGVPVDLTIYRTQQRGELESDQIDWRFRFTAMNDGALGDASVVSAAEHLDDEFAYAMISRMLEPVLFKTVYSLRQPNKNQLVLGKSAPRDGAPNFVDVEYTVDFSATEAERSVSSGPLATEARGTALFDRTLSFFTERSHTETSKVFIAEDALGPEKNLRMDKTLKVEVRVEKR